MWAMVLTRPGAGLQAVQRPKIPPAAGQLGLTVEACGVCRTDLHIVDGDLRAAPYPIVPGHEIVARVEAIGPGVSGYSLGQRVGVPWLGYTCGQCNDCRAGRENLCESAAFTGYQIAGGYAEYTVADARYCFPLDPYADAAELAPLLCAGLIGYRALRLAGEGMRYGLYGFGAAAHLLTQLLHHQGREVYAFTRAGDTASQAFARELGACWAGSTQLAPPTALDAALLFAPAGDLVPLALKAVRKGGSVVCAGIHMTDIPSFPYALLWGERSLRSVANLTRHDGEEFLSLAPKIALRAQVNRYPLRRANEALADLRAGRLQGAAVLIP